MIPEHYLIEEFSRRTGLSPRSDWSPEFGVEASRIAEKRGWSLAELLERLDDKLITELATRLTVCETFFLRHEGHFECITDFLAARLGACPVETQLKVWSAGCASGEEPYSVAISVKESLGEQALERLQIMATDISAPAIERGRAGSYGDWSFRGAPPWLLERYFDRADEKLQIKKRIQAAVIFECVTIFEKLERTPSDSIDLILFRNVAIYLEPWAWQRVYVGFLRVLKKDGLMLIAPADPVPEGALFERTELGGVRVYRPAASPIGFFARYSEQRWLEASHLASLRAIEKRQDEAVLRRPIERALAAGSLHSSRPAKRVSAPFNAKRLPGQLETSSPPLERARNARERANRGELAEALAIASQLITNHRTDSSGFVVRGELHMAMKNFEEAISDFRSALFLNPEDLLSRYWYCVALESGGRLDDARRQLQLLEKQLNGRPKAEMLHDGETAVSELLAAVSSLTQRLS